MTVDRGQVVILTITSSGIQNQDRVKLTLDESILGAAPAIGTLVGTCVLQGAATFVCDPDGSGELQVSFTVPNTIEPYEQIDVSAILVAPDSSDCAISSQSLLAIIGGTVQPTASPPPGSMVPTPAPTSDAPCAERTCPVDSNAPCQPFSVMKMMPRCYAGRCVAHGAHFDVECASSTCDGADDGTPCKTCDCACGKVSHKKLKVRDCNAPPTTTTTEAPATTTTTTTGGTPAPTPYAHHYDDEEREKIDAAVSWTTMIIVLSSVSACIILVLCCFFGVRMNNMARQFRRAMRRGKLVRVKRPGGGASGSENEPLLPQSTRQRKMAKQI